MRYITDQLDWRNDRAFEDHSDPYGGVWWSSEGERHATHASFGDRHDWQPSTPRARFLVTERLELWQARSWIEQGPFISLMDGDPSRPRLRQPHLDGSEIMLVVSGVLESSLDQWRFVRENVRLGPGDFVLRARIPDDFVPWITATSIRPEDILAQAGERIEWYLHWFPIALSASAEATRRSVQRSFSGFV